MARSDWYRDMPFITNMICTQYTNHILFFKRSHNYVSFVLVLLTVAGQVGLGVGSWPSNRATEGSNPKGTRLYFVDLTQECRKKIFDWH